MNAPLRDPFAGRRKSPRLNLRCRARIRIGKREYGGYIENISAGGARIRTLTPIRDFGPVRLILPDLPAMRGDIRWIEPHGAGVCFEISVCASVLKEWARSRLATLSQAADESGPTIHPEVSILGSSLSQVPVAPQLPIGFVDRLK